MWKFINSLDNAEDLTLIWRLLPLSLRKYWYLIYQSLCNKYEFNITLQLPSSYFDDITDKADNLDRSKLSQWVYEKIVPCQYEQQKLEMMQESLSEECMLNIRNCLSGSNFISFDDALSMHFNEELMSKFVYQPTWPMSLVQTYIPNSDEGFKPYRTTLLSKCNRFKISMDNIINHLFNTKFLGMYE